MKKGFILCILSLLFLSGCVQTLVLDEIQLIHSIGYDYYDEDRIEATVSVPVYTVENVIESEVITAVAQTSRDARLELNAQASRPLHSGKINSILFNEELAEKTGIIPILDTFSRDATIGMRNYVILTSGSTKELLSNSYPLEMEVATYIEQLIEQNMERQNIPKSNFHLFMKYYYEEGRDPFIPYIKQDAQHVQVDGVALFKGDRYVHRLDLSDAFVMKILLEPFAHGTYEIALKEKDEFAVLRNIDSQTKFTIEKGTNKPAIDLLIKFKGKVNEYSGERIDPKKLEEIKQTLTKKLEADANRLIALFQEKEIDPIGIGSRVKAKNYHFDLKEWVDFYPNATINVKAQVEITETGVRE
ncbi:Ger(x)C family spore germination protein [Alkalihalophilus sp. As8PL]|uniref:Ger(X)C family spore germination protein n=1 Tax=Alkalihalophilus sp. As8PL TaxID=3237103 RepID=A0AB39BVL5_9BACI